MTTFSLTLIPYRKQAFTVPLRDRDNEQATAERILDQSQGMNCIFSDLSYEFELVGNRVEEVREVKVFVNDVYEPCEMSGSTISFPASWGQERRIFLDCYGFVDITLDIVLRDETEVSLQTDYMPVLVKKGELNDAVKEMVSYVYSHQEPLLLNGEPKPKDIAALQDKGVHSLNAQLIMLEDIANIYESSYGYFKANARFHIDKVPVVDRLEKLQYVTPTTVQYIVSHPEQLSQVSSNSGIRMGNRFYHPKKVLAQQNVQSFDTYENRVVLGFLRRIISEIDSIRAHCQELLSRIPSDEQYSEDYIYSSFFMFIETKKKLNDGVARLHLLYSRFTQLLSLYCAALPIPSTALTAKPDSTPIFRSVPQYRRLFVSIYQWFNYGIYGFDKESFILSFIKVSQLYESYLLAKLIDYFITRGYTPKKYMRCSYPVRQTWKYKNTECNNTFEFEDSKGSITLYYQPVIYDNDQRQINGVGLYRNNTITSDIDGESSGRGGQRYYTPDFVLKINNSSGEQYLIMDAKFSDVTRVKRNSVKELAFKYLFSISPIDSASETVSGLSILYGKCSHTEQSYDVYDRKLPGTDIAPAFTLVPLMEGISTNDHFNRLDQLFNSLPSPGIGRSHLRLVING